MRGCALLSQMFFNEIHHDHRPAHNKDPFAELPVIGNAQEDRLGAIGPSKLPPIIKDPLLHLPKMLLLSRNHKIRCGQ